MKQEDSEDSFRTCSSASQQTQVDHHEHEFSRLLRIRRLLQEKSPPGYQKLPITQIPEDIIDILCSRADSSQDVGSGAKNGLGSSLVDRHIEEFRTSLWREEIRQIIDLMTHDLTGVRLCIKATPRSPNYRRHLYVPNLPKASLINRDCVVVEPLNFKDRNHRQYLVIEASENTILAENTHDKTRIELPFPRSGQHLTEPFTLLMTFVDGRVRFKAQVGDSFTIAEEVWPELTCYSIQRLEGNNLILGDEFEPSSYYPNELDIASCLKADFYLMSAGAPFRRIHQALTSLRDNHTLGSLIITPFQVEPVNSPLINLAATNTETLSKRVTHLDVRQRECIHNILEAKCRPFPYVIFAPPNTSEIETIVETIVQIYKRDRSKRVLVCANSNACVEYLHNELQATKVFDHNALKHFKGTESALRAMSTSPNNSMQSASPSSSSSQNIHTTVQVVVSTTFQAARLPYKSDYIFLFGAGRVHLPEALIPWSNLAPDGCMILSGDPYRLGPIVQTPTSLLNVPVLDGFLRMNRYAREAGVKYDKRFISLLNMCQECDPRLMAVSNNLYYANELVCKGQTPVDLLDQLGLSQPIAMIDIKGYEQSESRSWFNLMEVDECLHCLTKLYEIGMKPEQIAIITYYCLQKNYLKKRFEELMEIGHFDALNEKFKVIHQTEEIVTDKFEDGETWRKQQVKRQTTTAHPIDWRCRMDTVDSFQGQQKDVIIVSLVRRDAYYSRRLMEDERRFNATVTGARWLVIIIGDKDLMHRSSHWDRYIRDANSLIWRNT